MTLKTQTVTRGMTIDDDNHRLVFDRVDNEVRVFCLLYTSPSPRD